MVVDTSATAATARVRITRLNEFDGTDFHSYVELSISAIPGRPAIDSLFGNRDCFFHGVMKLSGDRPPSYATMHPETTVCAHFHSSRLLIKLL